MGAADRARTRLVDGLRDSGRLCSAAVEEAFRAVPRHLFLPGVPLARAYADEAVAVQAVDGVTTSSASQPSMMAIMLAQLDLRPGHRVLEVGAGTGYNAALMARLVGPQGRVVAVDIDSELVEGADLHLAAAGVSDVELVCADGALGHPPGAPYDRIVLTVGSGDVRPEWIAQLAPGGRLLLPLALRGTQLSVALDLGDDGMLRSALGPPVRLRPAARRGRDARRRGRSVDGVSVLPADGRRPAGSGACGTGRSRCRRGTCRSRWARRTSGTGSGCGWRCASRGRAGSWPGRSIPTTPTSTGSPPSCCRCAAARRASASSTTRRHAPGLAVVVLDPAADPGSRGPWPVRVRAFGPAGDALADRLLAAAAAWVDAGRPTPEDVRLTVVPAGLDASVPDDVTVVEQEHCRVLVHLY